MNERSIHHTRRRTLEEARAEKAGPYEEEWSKEDNYQKPPHDIGSELDAATAELEQHLEARGYKRPFVHHDGPFWHYKPALLIVDNGADPLLIQDDKAKRLLCAIGGIRAALDRGNTDEALMGSIFRVGRELEAWRVKPFNKAARGGVRQSVNAEAQQRKAYGTPEERDERDAKLLQEYEAMKEEKGDQLTAAGIRDELAAKLGLSSGDAVKKRLQRYRQRLGT